MDFKRSITNIVFWKLAKNFTIIASTCHFKEGFKYIPFFWGRHACERVYILAQKSYTVSLKIKALQVIILVTKVSLLQFFSFLAHCEFMLKKFYELIKNIYKLPALFINHSIFTVFSTWNKKINKKISDWFSFSYTMYYLVAT